MLRQLRAQLRYRDRPLADEVSVLLSDAAELSASLRAFIPFNEPMPVGTPLQLVLLDDALQVIDVKVVGVEEARKNRSTDAETIRPGMHVALVGEPTRLRPTVQMVPSDGLQTPNEKKKKKKKKRYRPPKKSAAMRRK